MVAPEIKTEFQALASKAVWDIAKHFGCGYEGDSDPIRHDVVFYDIRDWEAYGYASCVEFWTDPDSDDETLVVSCGTINRLEGDDMEGAWQCIGMNADSEERSNIHAQISACRAHAGIEPDDYTQAKRFKLDDWQEWRIWRSVADWLTALGS